MKGGNGNGKRRWKGLVISVMGLVILSMLLPLVFLLGFHNAFYSSSSGFPSSEQQQQPQSQKHDDSRHVKDLILRLAPPLPIFDPVGKKDKEKSAHSRINESITKVPDQVLQRKGSPRRPVEIPVQKVSPERHKVNISSPDVIHRVKSDESEVPCELRFGSYCIWRRERKEAMMDFMVKKMKDRLFVARAYFPSILKLPAYEKLSRDLRQNIQDFERILSEAATDADLPPHVEDKLQKMEAAIEKAKSVPAVNCNNVDKKFRQLVDLTEDEANFHTKQSSFLYQLAVQTMPKSLHCLSMRLTVEHFHTSFVDLEDSVKEKYVDQELFHYVIFSTNILASSVAINSTVAHAKDSKKLVFHILTDQQNFYAMRLWFDRNSFKKATIQVLNIEDYNMAPGLSLPEEFRVTMHIAEKLPDMHYKTEYLSLFSHSHFLLPEIFKNLNKIVVLDDDIVVQQDLSALWEINMGKMVNGAAEYCGIRLGQLDDYLGKISFNQKSCAWMSGLNVINLGRWRELNLTRTFQKSWHELKIDGTQHEAAASRASLLAFQDLVYALGDKWVLSGLGHNYGLDLQSLTKFAVLHFNGNMKPWLELGIPKYRSLWVKFLNREDRFLSDCNVIL